MATFVESTFETGTLAEQGWTEVYGTAALSPGNGYGGTQSLRVLTNADAVARYFPELTTPKVTVNIRCVDIPNDPGGNLIGISLEHWQDTVTRCLGWYIRGDLKIGLLRGSSEIATSTLTIVQNVYAVIELNVPIIADSGGNAVVTVNGVEYINFTGDTHGGSGPNAVDRIVVGNIQAFGASTTHDFDNVLIEDGNVGEFEPEPAGTSNGPISGEIAHHTIPLGITDSAVPEAWYRTQFTLNGAGGDGFGDFDGECTFYLELVASNSGSTTKTCKVYGDAGATEVATINIPPSGVALLPRVEFIPTDTDIYIVETPETNDGDIEISEIRVIIDQVNGTRRTVYFPFGCAAESLFLSSDATTFTGELDRTGNHAVPGAHEQWYPCSSITLFKYVASDWDHISFLRFWVLGGAAFATAYYRLFDYDAWVGDGSPSPMPETSHIHASEVWYPYFDQLAQPVLTEREISIQELTDGHTYGVCFRSGHAGRNAMIYNAWLDIILDAANKCNSYFRFMKFNTGGNITTSRFRLNYSGATNFSGLIETDASNPSGGIVNVSDVGTTDEGTAGATIVGSVTPSAARGVYRSSPVTPGDSGNRYIGQTTVASVTTNGSFFILHAEASNTPFTTTCPLPSAQAGVPYSAQILFIGSTLIIIGGALPSGLTMSSSGLISGTPTVTGSFSITVQAS